MEQCFVVAIPSYERYKIISKRVLLFLQEGQVDKRRIFIFVSDASQAELYASHVSSELYGEIVIGIKGIAQQRNFIRNYFPVGQFVVSLDDDITRLKRLVNGKLQRVNNLDDFFTQAFKVLEQTGLYIWGIFSTNSTLHMKGQKEEISTALKFLSGGCHGYIARRDKCLDLNTDQKDDYEQSLRYWKLDGGIVRFNHVCANESAPRKGGLGKDRLQMNKDGSAYVKSQFPDNVIEWMRPDGRHEIRLRENLPHG